MTLRLQNTSLFKGFPQAEIADRLTVVTLRLLNQRYLFGRIDDTHFDNFVALG
jgi:hypothetical protein